MSLIGSSDPEAFRNQVTCGTGCVAGLMVLAFAVTYLFGLLMCCFTWPPLEYIDRQTKRAAAHKAIRERKEAEEEARLRAEAGAEDAADAKGHGHGH